MKSKIKRMYPVFDCCRRTERQDEVKYHIVAKDQDQALSFIHRNRFDPNRFRYVSRYGALCDASNVTVILLPGWSQRSDYVEISRVLGSCVYRNVKIVKVEDFVASLN